MENYLSRGEHEEFARRMEDEHKRQNRRICDLEEAVKQYGALTVAVEKMATNMKAMLDEQKSQGDRLVALESRDGEKWRSLVGYVLVAVIGVLIGYVAKQIGM